MSAKETIYSVEHRPGFLEFMLVSLFGGVMALSALCFAWRLANQVWHVGSLMGELIGWSAILVFAILTTAYNAQPSVMILVAPFALAFNGYEGLGGGQVIRRVLFFILLFSCCCYWGSKILLLTGTTAVIGYLLVQTIAKIWSGEYK